MARRTRLEAPDARALAEMEEGFAAKPVPDRLGLGAPIAQVAAEAARASDPRSQAMRLKEARDGADAAAWREASDQGRVIQSLSLDSVVMEHLARDRMTAAREALDELKSSIRANGQRSPIEVVALGQGRYGLVSGWRRMVVLGELREEGAGDQVMAIIRQPAEAGAAYTAMVEENEIRAQLSPYERGRIAVIAADQGAFRGPDEAVDAIFAAASKAKRSKIRSFALVHEEIGDMLTFATDLSERNGLRLAQALRQGWVEEIRRALATGLGVDAAREWAVLEPVVARAEARLRRDSSRGGRPRSGPARAEVIWRDPSGGAVLECDRGEDGVTLRLSGADVDHQLQQDVIAAVRGLLDRRG